LCTCDEIYTSRGLKAPDCPWHSLGVEEAMEEYAKEVAIELLNFVTSETSPFAIMYGNQPDRFATNDREYTSEEVYNLYHQKTIQP
jgi:hypothetical protein